MELEMGERIITGLLLVVAIIHILPVSGFTGVARLESLYGVAISGSDLEILMRHRAVLFGILGVFFAYAAFTPSMQPLAFIAAFATIFSFFYLAATVEGYNAAIHKVVLADVVAAICLLVSVVIYMMKGRI